MFRIDAVGRSLGSASECPIICEVAVPALSSPHLGMLNMLTVLRGGIGIMWLDEDSLSGGEPVKARMLQIQPARFVLFCDRPPRKAALI